MTEFNPGGFPEKEVVKHHPERMVDPKPPRGGASRVGQWVLAKADGGHDHSESVACI